MTDFLPSTADPQNIEAEEALLGAVLINPEAYHLAATFLYPADFYIHRNGWIWEAMGALVKKASPLDALTISEELSKQGRLAEAGGAAYLAQLMSDVPTSMHAEAYGHIVEEAAIRRRMLVAASTIAQVAHDPQADVFEALAGAERGLFEARQRKTTQKTLTQQVGALYDVVEERAKFPRDVWGLDTGFPKLNWHLGGWQRDELTLLAGDSGIGKSILLGLFAKNVSMHHHAVLYSLEMADQDFLMRLLSAESGIMTKQMKSGRVLDWAKFVQSCEKMTKLNLHIDDNAELTLERLRSDLYRRMAEGTVDWVGVDYLGLMSCRAPDDMAKEKILSRGLKLIAREFHLPVVAAHSTNKEGMDAPKAKKRNISGPSQNVFNCDNALILTKDEATPNLRTLTICKSRNEAGEGDIPLVKVENTPSFVELEQILVGVPEPRTDWRDI